LRFVWEEKHKEMIVASDPQTTQKKKKRQKKKRKKKTRRASLSSSSSSSSAAVWCAMVSYWRLSRSHCDGWVDPALQKTDPPLLRASACELIHSIHENHRPFCLLFPKGFFFWPFVPPNSCLKPNCTLKPTTLISCWIALPDLQCLDLIKTAQFENEF
jgi:hypothetical protein